MKFLHTADWQIGMKAAHVGEAAEVVRQERLEAARRVVAAATEHSVEFILVAGDTFEHNAVPRVDVQSVADILGAFPGPVYLIPGNHDPLVSGSVWDYGAWEEHENLNILRDAEPLGIPGGLLLPCPIMSRHSMANPTAWMPGRQGDELRIGLAHGTLAIPGFDDHSFPIPLDTAGDRDLDYLALGHWHSTLINEDGRTAYSGTHETTAFGERNSGNALVVTLRPGSEPVIEPVMTGRLRWVGVGAEDEIRSADDLTDRIEEIRSLPSPDRTLLRVHLHGVMPPSAIETLRDLEALLDARFLHAELDRDRLVPSPDDPGWIDALPGGSVEAAVAQRLLGMASALPEGAEHMPAVAAEALQLLYGLMRGVDR